MKTPSITTAGPGNEHTGGHDVQKGNREHVRVSITIWLSAREAAKQIGKSADTIERRGIPWQGTPVPFRLRYTFLVLDRGADAIRSYYEPDLEALLFAPDALPRDSRPRLVPRFKNMQRR